MSATVGAVVLVGRILFALFFLRSGYGHLRRGPMMTEYARSKGFPVPLLASWPSGVWLTAAALSVALGAWPDLGALMLGAFVIPAALYFHDFWRVEDQSQRETQVQSFLRNVLVLGASLILFALFAWTGDDLRYSLTAPLINLR